MLPLGENIVESGFTESHVKHLRLTKSQFARVEDRLQNFLFRRGYAAPDPSRNQFE